MGTLRQQIATNVLTVTRFRDLIKNLQAARPNETLDIYAPIAHRLGMGKIRGELEDLGFRFLDPIGYQQVHVAVEARRKEGEAFLEGVQRELREKLKEAGITASVDSRIKRLSSIHKKLIRQRITVDQGYD